MPDNVYSVHIRLLRDAVRPESVSRHVPRHTRSHGIPVSPDPTAHQSTAHHGSGTLPRVRTM